MFGIEKGGRRQLRDKLTAYKLRDGFLAASTEIKRQLLLLFDFAD